MATATLKKPKTETLQEFTDNRGTSLKVDRENGVIRGVKILGLSSRNGRSYSESAVRNAISLYEGSKVNVNHVKGAGGSPRDYQDRMGHLKGVHEGTDGGLVADFHFNPKHSLAEQLMWDAEHAPENVGFSHSVDGKTKSNGKGVVVEQITKVHSVDLVADPATTKSLFEAETMETETIVETNEQKPEVKESALTENLQKQVTTLTEQINKLTEQCTAQAADIAARKLDDEIRTELKEAKLDDVSDVFLSALRKSTKDERKLLLEDRRNIARKPQSRDQHVTEGEVKLETLFKK